MVTIITIIGLARVDAMAELDDGALYRLQAWLSPAFPVGAFAYSHGLEFAVEDGGIKDRGELLIWLEGILKHGAGRLDADFFCRAWRAGTPAELAAVNELSQAWRGSGETAMETANQGAAFVRTLRAAWPALADGLPAVISYPVAVGQVAARAGIPLRPALIAYLHAAATNLVSAAVRLIPLGQSDGQWVTAQLEPLVLASAAAAETRPDDEMGSAALTVDWTSMQT